MQAGLESSPAVAFRADGTALAVVGDPRQHVAVWDVTRRAHLVTMVGRYLVTGVVLNCGGGLLAMASPGGEVTIWDFGRHVPLGPLPGFHPRRGAFSLSPRTATFTGDGRRLAISDETGSVFVWSTSPELPGPSVVVPGSRPDRPGRRSGGRGSVVFCPPGPWTAPPSGEPLGTWRSLVSAPVWGTGGRRFKSGRPDQTSRIARCGHAPRALGAAHPVDARLAHAPPG